MEFSKIEKEIVKLEKAIRSWVTDEQAAEDILQETLLKAWIGMSEFREDSSVYTWLYRIALNEHLKYKRDYEKPNVSLDFDLSHNDSPDMILESEEGFENLTPRQKEYLSHHLSGLKDEEISEMVGITEETVRSTRSHSKKKITN